MRRPATKQQRKYGGQTPAERAADRRDRLVAAALKLFGSQGYHNTSIEQLCAEARVTARHFYEEFGDRERLFRAVYDRVIAESAQAILVGLASVPRDAPNRIEAGVRSFVEFMLVDPRRARIQCLESLGVSDSFTAYRRDVLRSFARLVAREADDAIARTEPRELHLAALALTAGADSLIIEHLVDPEGAPVDAIVRVVTHIFEATAAGRRR